MISEKDFNLNCPISISEHPHIVLAHGGGGKLMHNLIHKMFAPLFGDSATQHDGTVMQLGDQKLAFTTDSYVVSPLLFPGGDIGQMAVYGTVNDLAMCGARPLFLTLGLILEEGLPMETLWRVAQSIQAAASRANVRVITGDTKVVDRGKGDGIFINTAGVGVVEHHQSIGPKSIQPGDVIALSGDIGRHGIAIMATREGLAFESAIESDTAPLADLVLRLLSSGVAVHCLRDLTRGGLASALVEIAKTAGKRLHIHESAIPVREDVRGACELLGLDPLYVANEGRFVAIVSESDAEKTLAIMREFQTGTGGAIIGEVVDDRPGMVTMISAIGADRIVDMLSGEQLPRIC